MYVYHDTRSGDETATDQFQGGCNPGWWGHIPGRGTAEDSCSPGPNHLPLFCGVCVGGEGGGRGRAL